MSFTRSALAHLLGVGLIFFSVGPVTPAWAQHVVRGVVVAADTGAPLSAATVQIGGTYRGTIANTEGRFSLEVDRMPAVLLVRFVGYRTERIELDRAPPESMLIRLHPEPYTLPGLVVSSEDPAVGIMRKVIAKKAEMRLELERFRANAYNRFTLENDTGIVSIVESLTEFMWDHERGTREVVKASRQTANMDVDDFLPAGLLVANLYDDDIDVGGHNLPGVTHPNAVDRYDFRLQGTTVQDGREIYTISVHTRNRLASGFKGQIVVADSAFVMLSAELRPNDSFVFPPPIQFFDLSYMQQFLEYGGQWLPADFRSELELKVGFRGILDFPVFRIGQFSRLSDYEVNVSLPDSLYASREILHVDSVAVSQGLARLDDPGVAVPLTGLEERAYDGIDSTMTVEEAFAPGGVLGRASRVTVGDDSGSASGSFLDVSPSVWYNRAEGWSPAVTVGLGRGSGLDVRVGYAFGLNSVNHGYRLRLHGGRLQASAGWDRRARTTYDSWTRTRTENSISFLVGRHDYFDYYQATRMHAGLTFDIAEWDAEVTVAREEAEPLATTTTWQLARDVPVTPNPAVDGTVSWVQLRLAHGDRPDPFGITMFNSVRAVLETGATGIVGGDEVYVRGRVRATTRIPTFFRRRLLPQSLDLHASVALSAGSLPIRRMWTVDGGNHGSRPGSLRTLAGRPMVGDRAVFIGWEHHFRTVPFERLGWEWAVRRGWGVIAFGGHGRTWLRQGNQTGAATDLWLTSVPDSWHHEVGLSFNGFLGVFRIDVARRLDRPDWVIGLGAAKLF